MCCIKRTTRPEDVARVKEITTQAVMIDAHQRGIPLAALLEGLLESAASALASGVVLDAKNKVICGDDDEAHIAIAVEAFRQACYESLADARQTLLKPSLVMAGAGRAH